MKKINLNDAIGKIDDSLVEKAIETDTKEKMQELKMIEKQKNKFKIFKYFGFCASSLAVLVIGVIMINYKSVNDNVQIPNPYIEINTIDDLGKYLKLNIDYLNFKPISQISKIDGQIFGEIIYEDNSIIRISKDDKDNSGIYGSKLKEKININKENVEIYECDKYQYALWYKDGYTYSYLKADKENIKEILEKIIEGEK